MSETHEIIRIFIASPSGLDGERRAIWEIVEEINRRNSSHWLLQFKAIGWEDTVGGNRRAQDIINRDLETCDYFFGIMADHWGSPSHSEEDAGVAYTSGFEEEYTLAQKLYERGKMKDILLFFKDIPEERMRDIGPSLRKVLDFKQKVTDDRQPLFREFGTIEAFRNKIGDALTKIGWDTTTPRSGSNIAAQSEKNTAEVVLPSAMPPSAREYFLSQSTREFLHAIQNKSGEHNAVSNVDIARLRLISAGVHRTGNDDTFIGVHDANLLFRSRFSLDLSDTEKATLLTAGLQYMGHHNVPFWYWLGGDVERTKRVIQYRMTASDDRICSAALKLAGVFGYRAPAPPPQVSAGYWVKKWFENEQAYALRDAAERYLDNWAEEEDIPALQEVRQGKSGLQAANLDCIMVGVRFRQSQADGFADLKERNPEQISPGLQGMVQPMIPSLTTGELEQLARLKAEYLRLASIKELVHRNALGTQLAEELSGDHSIDVRLEAIKALTDQGVEISVERAKEALVFKTSKYGLGGLLAGAGDTEDTSKFDEYRRHVLSKRPLEELLALEEKDGPFEADALLIACRVYPRRTTKLLRDLVEDGFKERFERRLKGITGLSPTVGVKLEEQARRLKGFTCSGLTRKALEILVGQGRPRDLALVREVVDREEVESSEPVLEYFARFGGWDDIERVMALKDKVGGPTSLLTTDVPNNDGAKARAVVKIANQRIVDLLERIQSHPLLSGVIKAIGAKAFSRLSDDRVLLLLNAENEDVRKLMALRCLVTLRKARIAKLLQRYVQEEEYRYYNVIHWLDLGTSMPRAYSLKIARTELNNL